MKFDKLIRARYSVRRFSQKPVEERKISAILEAAKVAPSAKNAQSWRVLVISSRESLEKMRRCTPCHYQAPLVFVLGYDRTKCYRREEDGAASGEIDAAIAGTHMMLEACELGIGSTWVMNFDPEKVKESFHIPKEVMPVSLLVCGYPGSDSEISPRHTQYEKEDTLWQFNDYG